MSAILSLTSCKDRNAGSPAAAAPSEGGPPVVWQEPIDVAQGSARVGPWRMNESEFHYVDDPSVALREDGSVAVVFADNERKDIFLQRYGRTGELELASPVNVSRSPRVFSWLPRLVMAGDSVFVLWEEIVFSGGSHGGEIFFARSLDGGRTFSAPDNLSNTPAGAGKGRLTRDRWDNGSLDLAGSSSGTLYAAWTEYEGALWFSRSTDGGARFSRPFRMDGEGDRPARGPSLACAPDGKAGIYLAWTVGEDERADIRVAVSNDGGQSFQTPRRAVETSGHSDAPKVAVDGEGTVHLVYGERSDGPFTRSIVQYARLRDPQNGSFEPPRTLSGQASQEAAGASFPSLAVSGNGRVYVLWEHHPDPGADARGLRFTVSVDGGETFPPPADVPGSTDEPPAVNGSRQGKLMKKLAVTGGGEVAAVNSQFRHEDRSLVRLLRGRLSDAAAGAKAESDKKR